MKPLLIGQAPGPKTDPDDPLAANTVTGRRLAELCGLDQQAYTSAFQRANLLHYFPGRTGSDDRFPIREARAAALALRPFLRGRSIIMIGRGVAQAFGYRRADLPFCEQRLNERWGFFYSCIPHPSGRNRAYNEQQTREQVSSFINRLLNPLERGMLVYDKEIVADGSPVSDDRA